MPRQSQERAHRPPLGRVKGRRHAAAQGHKGNGQAPCNAPAVGRKDSANAGNARMRLAQSHAVALAMARFAFNLQVPAEHSVAFK
jgi:hypothetical protein